LQSLSTGVSAGDNDDINCDCADDVGASIMLQMDGLPYSDVIMRTANKVKTLAQVNTVAVPGKKHVNIDANVLFGRLVIIMSRCPDIAPYFKHELTAMPAALFKDNFMRKLDKAQLKHELIKSVIVTPQNLG